MDAPSNTTQTREQFEAVLAGVEAKILEMVNECCEGHGWPPHPRSPVHSIYLIEETNEHYRVGYSMRFDWGSTPGIDRLFEKNRNWTLQEVARNVAESANRWYV